MTARILYDKPAAAEALSTSERRIDELRRARLLVAVQDGREWKYTADELQRYAGSLKTSVEG
ncbi:hypothetical protein [Mycolicibacterium sphagni]|uniref:DNA-binding protein n=1 Tax=Mycolicibacterium sphagni TaxID=1786 RepID=A0A255DBQ1_9MYCO|nr:hypothetical protein [Mycolicibacterium sphagni]OYN76848.1 hypothetical protein CG716_20250 [Mycolicibacterium sphagni]